LLTGFVLSLPAASLMAQSLAEVTAEECVFGDCTDGRGRLELTTQWGKGEYYGSFRAGEFHGKGRLEIPISFTAKAIYDGYYDMGVRSGRGTYWNGDGKLYIGQWKDDKRNGYGSYCVGLSEWSENEHSEYWMKENLENYTGNFVDDFYHGEGTYRWPDGVQYSGGWAANKKHGRGYFLYPTGLRSDRVFRFDERVYDAAVDL